MYEFIITLIKQIENQALLEWLATITGFLCVYLATKQNILNWPISIITVSIYLYIFYQNRLYGDSILQIYFLGTACYGWYFWKKQKQENQKPISSLSNKQIGLTIALICLLTVCIGTLLDKFTDTDVPYIDALCTSISLVAQFLMMRKVLQNWLLWVIVDIMYIPLYIHKNLFLTAILYLAYMLIAWKGYKDWAKSYQKFE